MSSFDDHLRGKRLVCTDPEELHEAAGDEVYWPVLVLASDYDALRSRLAEAEVLLRWCDEHWRSHVYEGAPSVRFLSRIGAFLTPVSQPDHDCRFYMRFDGMCSLCGKHTAMDIQNERE